MVAVLLISLISFVIHHSYANPFMVVSHPFKNSGSKSNLFEVLEWKSGIISKTGHFFQMECVTDGTIIFIEDGQWGIVAQDRGSVGIFRLSSTGKPTVVKPAFHLNKCYASRIIADPKNISRVFILDGDSVGGIYALRISTSGDVIDEGLYMPAVLPVNLIFPAVGDGSALLIGMNGVILIINWPSKAILFNISAFKDNNAIVSTATLTYDQRYLVVLDDNTVTGHTRLAVLWVDVTTNLLSRVQLITRGIKDPTSIVCSPYNNAMLMTSCQGNAIVLLSYNVFNTTHPLNNEGPIIVSGEAPQLPTTIIAMYGTNGNSARVLVSELLGVRQIEFTSVGGARDFGWLCGYEKAVILS